MTTEQIYDYFIDKILDDRLKDSTFRDTPIVKFLSTLQMNCYDVHVSLKNNYIYAYIGKDGKTISVLLSGYEYDYQVYRIMYSIHQALRPMWQDPDV